MEPELSEGAIERIMCGEQVDKPILQVLGQKKIAGSAGGSADRYRLLLSDGRHSHSSAMLATQLNHMITDNELEQFSVLQLDKYLCNQIQPDRRVLILLDIHIIASGQSVGLKLGNPQPYKAGAAGSQNNNAEKAALQPMVNGGNTTNRTPQQNKNSGGSFYGNKPQQRKNFNAGASNLPSTPGGSQARVYPIDSLTPYQNKWTIKARVTQKSNIRTWSNSRGEGKLFSMNLLDDSGEIKATAFRDEVDKYYNMIEVNKVYYISRATLKPADKRYSSVNNDYEMTFNSDTQVQHCEEEGNLPTMKFSFVPINQLESHQPNSTVDVIGIVKSVNDMTTVVGKASNREIKKRDVQLVDKTGVMIRMTLWGAEAESFKGDDYPVMAVKGCKLSDWGGRSLSALASSQILMNPESEEAYSLRGWFDSEGASMDFSEYSRGDSGSSGGGSGTNWKSFAEAKSQFGGGDGKADYYTAKATVVFMKKENCMYTACPTADCNKKVIDQGNGMFRCEKCQQEFPNFKYRMILNANLADHTDNQWATCFQDSGEQLLGISAKELGEMKDQNSEQFDRVFNEAQFKSYIFRLRAKQETYNDESRVKTVVVEAKPMNFEEYNRKLMDDIEKMMKA